MDFEVAGAGEELELPAPPADLTEVGTADNGVVPGSLEKKEVESEPSLRLFRRAGFEKWGTLHEVAEIDGRAVSVSILAKKIGS
jgi:hypothetical protein